MEPIEITVSGWKARQEAAKRKMANGKTKEERADIREARRRLYDEQAFQMERVSEGTGEPMVETTGEPIRDEPQADSEDQAPGNAADAGSTEGKEETVEMTREEMIAELKDAGQTVNPKSKDETLIKKVEALRNGDA